MTVNITQSEWAAIWKMCHPRIFVNVSGCRASILMLESKDASTGRTKYKDITDLIPNGEQLAADAVEDFGGVLNMSGWYPPSIEILDAIEKLDEERGANKWQS